MDQAIVSARVQAGFAKIAANLGVAGAQYRPVSAQTPMGQAYAQPMMVFDSSAGFSLGKPLNWGVPTEYAALSTQDVSVGDILVSGTAMYFVARIEAMRPVLCVVCTRIVSVAGVPGTNVSVLSGCPAAVLLRSHGDREDSGMPGSMRPGQFILYLPVLPGVVLQPYMSVTDDLGNIYSIAAVETTTFGFRCVMTSQQV